MSCLRSATWTVENSSRGDLENARSSNGTIPCFQSQDTLVQEEPGCLVIVGAVAREADTADRCLSSRPNWSEKR